MAKVKQPVVTGVSDFSVTLADNGFVVDYSGSDIDDNWTSTKKLLLTVDELVAEIKDIITKR